QPMNQRAAREALKKYFGYDNFRPQQFEIIDNIYIGYDAVVLMPTGGGKSICYQIPAITLPGTCVVVSPLISLMKDQVEALKGNGIPAAYLNSSLSVDEQRYVEDEAYHGRLRLLYVSPEKMVSPSFMPLLSKLKLNLFAIDEAHCISAWGHDFRQEYTQMRFLKRQFPRVPIVALTATADKLTRRDIVTQLGLREPAVFISSFDRPNISLNVRPGQKRIEQILDFIGERSQQAGIVYCLSRKSTEQVAAKLIAKGIRADFYHAGLPAAERNRVQEAFTNDEVHVVCATVAFGMGIDKSNVRWVIHYNLPQNIEGYYQEIGRAGRDGAQADALLFYSFQDVMVLRDILTKEESKNTEIKLAKLERMQQYADALNCRRKILLSYFGEHLAEDCGNCDVCKNPPQSFDGTVIAQKALSAVTRLGEKVGLRMLIDVLRGSRRKDLLQLGYDQIKTYGMGADITANDWMDLLRQMLHLGLIEIAYDQNNVVKLTAASRAVLFEKQAVTLVRMSAIREQRAARKTKVKTVTQRQRVRDELFEVLRQLRRQIAVQKGVPPYIVFSDATLEEMAAERPSNERELRSISGVGEQKLARYGRAFLGAIRDFVADKTQEGVRVKGGSQLATLQLYRRGFPPEQIALERDVTVQTVYNHLLEHYQNGEEVRVQDFVSKPLIQTILLVAESIPEPRSIKAIYERLGERVDYHQIRFALAYLEKKGKEV
ncbi:MAG: DNA helicase RecQ, partial [Bacteroidota bacterium]